MVYPGTSDNFQRIKIYGEGYQIFKLQLYQSLKIRETIQFLQSNWMFFSITEVESGAYPNLKHLSN